jgi:hypothetical protein
MPYFTKPDGQPQRKSYYFSKDYQKIMKLLTQNSDEYGKFYEDTPNVMVLAAALAMQKGLPLHKEIPVAKRADSFYGGYIKGMDYYQALIVFLYSKENGQSILEEESDDELQKIFLGLANSGLEYLNQLQFESTNTNQSPSKIIIDELNMALKRFQKN